MITCVDYNIGSRKTIEKAGGILENIVFNPNKETNYSQDLVAAIVAKVSPNCEKTAANKFSSSEDLSFEIKQAIEVIKLTNSQEPKINTSIYYMKMKGKTSIVGIEKFRSELLIRLSKN